MDCQFLALRGLYNYNLQTRITRSNLGQGQGQVNLLAVKTISVSSETVNPTKKNIHYRYYTE